MKFIEQNIQGVWVIEPSVFSDDRGYFMESFRQSEFEKFVGKTNFIQDNESKSSRGVLRGLHYQTGEHAQAKLVRVVQGSVLDVAVDIRKSSPTFGKYVAVELTAENKKQLFVPRGFAHGFVVLSDIAIFTYKIDNIYAPNHEASIIWSDPTIAIDWGISEDEILLSGKDKTGKLLTEAILFE
ncbi:dTDP-4-dehydrorhamnose 3,5-epimerase [Dysgonomonas alginatilytica]|uniref:dTDP-4-dehydrorhamnose 3,5-epimerase n=1 Tax=Dysgonomonas alginatilytica TaxID=1605892 RepID=A0A2V3PPC3_9BACT|nr:dTDP-4-dehydrorhamnose 3,5-epimerase [Dysgonomonas alginatilytica]PXV63151.1 dTDP-4-dehydrorhamnose 3,5-epimerase [Dysgonomonas alginatilytica]